MLKSLHEYHKKFKGTVDILPKRLEEEKIQKIRGLRAIGKSIDEISQEMDLLDEHVSRGAIHKITKSWDSLTDEEKQGDKTVEWENIEEYGLPWESSGYLLEHWWRFAFENVDPNTDHYGDKPTVRLVKWWWRIHQAVPSAPQEVVARLAGDFASIEQGSDAQSWDLDFDGLWQYMAFKPWENDESGQAYLEATENGQIPSLPRGVPHSFIRNLLLGFSKKHGHKISEYQKRLLKAGGYKGGY